MKIYTSLLILILFVLNNINASTYYVAKNGYDSASGSEQYPWLTIQKAGNTLVAGDTVFVKAGKYSERVFVKNSGTQNNFIVFSTYKDDEVIIDGEKESWDIRWNGLFDIYGKNNIVIEGFSVMNSDYGGIWVDSCSYVIIRNNYTYNTFSSGIGVWNSNHIYVENNEVELACNDGDQECISIGNSAYCDVFNNDVHHNGPGNKGGEGIDVKQGSHDVSIFNNEVHHLTKRLGIYADAWDTLTYNINIYSNIVHHIKECGIAVASEAGGTIGNVNIFNNLIYMNKFGGIELGEWSDIGFKGKKPVKHIKIINNTCYKNGSYDDGWGFGIVIDNPDASNIVIRNNICSQNTSQIAIQKIADIAQIDHNLIDGFNGSEFAEFGKDSIVESPMFADTSAFDFYLKSDSPAIDKASSYDAPEFDIEGKTRPNGFGYDIGAFEHYYPLFIEKNINDDFVVYPNPAKDYLYIDSNPSDEIKEVKIFNLSGQMVLREIYKSNTINISKLQDGSYIIILATSNKTYFSKIIVCQD